MDGLQAPFSGALCVIGERMAFYFSMEIEAPDGLLGIEEYIHKCKMNLKIWKSALNGKILLKRVPQSNFEWSMNSYKAKIVASGEFFESIDLAKENLESLSNVLSDCDFSHQILLDNEDDYLFTSYSYKWKKGT